MGINFEEDKIVSVCPGSGALEIHKRWPAEKFGKLIEGLMRFTNLKFFILGTYEEIDLEYMILSQVSNKNNVFSFVGRHSIEETAEVLHQSAFTICNCNGLLHVAESVGTFVVGIYGPTDPTKTGVYSENKSIVSVNEECSPCYRRGFTQGCEILFV